MTKISVIGNIKTLRDIEIVKEGSMFAKDGMIYFQCSDTPNPITTDPYIKMKMMEIEFKEKMENRLRGIEYWKRRATESCNDGGADE